MIKEGALQRLVNIRFVIIVISMSLFFASPGVVAQPLLQASGTVALTDGQSPAGTEISLKVDLNEDGSFAGFETVRTVADASGNYTLNSLAARCYSFFLPIDGRVNWY